jgi:peptide-methionine (R)-S-oxide reductase
MTLIRPILQTPPHARHECGYRDVPYQLLLPILNLMKMFTFLLPLLMSLAGCEVTEPAISPTAATTPAAKESTMPADPSDTKLSAEMLEKVEKTEEQWKKELTEEEFYVLREKGTERPYTNEYDHHFESGAYACAACGLVLFESDTKFNSGCGWPAFYAAKAGDRVVQTADYALGMIRTEVTCARCGSHLGHIFDDAPQTPTGQRYCINSVSLDFIPKEELEKRAAERQQGSNSVKEAQDAENTEHSGDANRTVEE